MRSTQGRHCGSQHCRHALGRLSAMELHSRQQPTRMTAAASAPAMAPPANSTRAPSRLPGASRAGSWRAMCTAHAAMAKAAIHWSSAARRGQNSPPAAPWWGGVRRGTAVGRARCTSHRRIGAHADNWQRTACARRRSLTQAWMRPCFVTGAACGRALATVRQESNLRREGPLRASCEARPWLGGVHSGASFGMQTPHHQALCGRSGRNDPVTR